MPLFTSEYVFSDDYPTIEPSLKLDFANARALDPRITFTRASTATYVGANGLIKTAGDDEPRFDHDPTTGESLGLLIEESRINLIPHSQELNAATWNKYFGSSVSANYATAPDGTQTADRIIFNGTSAGQITHNLSGLTIGQQYVFSAWVKSDGTSTNGCLLYMNGTSIQIIPTNEWQRIYVVRTAANTGENPLFLCGSVNSLLVWGAQLEAGSFPTSYIPTSGSTATRAVDNASITGASFSNFYNPTEGSVYCNYNRIGLQAPSTTVPTPWGFSDGSFSNSMSLVGGYSIPTNRRFDILVSGSATAQLNFTNAETALTYHKAAVAYKTNDVAGSYNGGSILTDTDTNIPAVNQLCIGRRDPLSLVDYLNGHIAQLSYYPKRLTNAQLQTLTQ